MQGTATSGGESSSVGALTSPAHVSLDGGFGRPKWRDEGGRDEFLSVQCPKRGN